MNSIRILLFAGARETVNAEWIDVCVQLPTTVDTLKKELGSQYPLLRPWIEFGRIAIGNEFVDDNYILSTLHANLAVALIPPVSGG